MEKSTQTSLCKGLRACGISKSLTHEILNTVCLWYDSSGKEWTSARIKDLRQWYESCLGGHPEPPKWFRHGSDGYPLDIWKKVFKLSVPKALGVLSLNTVFYEDSLSETQLEKFRKELAGNHEGNLEEVQELFYLAFPKLVKAFKKEGSRFPRAKFTKMPDLRPISILDIPLNKACPIENSLRQLTPQTDGDQLKALVASWESVPQVTFDWLERHERWDILPMEVIGNAYQLELNKPHANYVGRIGVIQEPQLKARIVANPNRVTQHTLGPLRTVYEELDRALPSTCIHDQEVGMGRVQEQLRQGFRIAGSDLTSASGLLNLTSCLWLVDHTFGLKSIKGYEDYTEYFTEVSRSQWYFPHQKEGVSWKQGDPLGTEPSIFLLDLANTCAGLLAWGLAVEEESTLSSTDPWECFGTLGDDIWMRAEMQPSYERIIKAMGGEINHSKTLISDRVAEFAGRVITTEGVYLKKVNYCEPSDNSFMNYMSQLGPQAKWLLRPRQRRVYEMFSHLPGIVVSGPWSTDSFGEPLSLRYQWYLEEVKPVLDREEPDPSPMTIEEVELRADLRLRQDEGLTVPRDLVRPYLEPEDYPASVATQSGRHGDPRTVNGQSLLKSLEKHGRHITPYSQWKNQELLRSSMNTDVMIPVTEDVSPTNESDDANNLETLVVRRGQVPDSEPSVIAEEVNPCKLRKKQLQDAVVKASSASFQSENSDPLGQESESSTNPVGDEPELEIPEEGLSDPESPVL